MQISRTVLYAIVNILVALLAIAGVEVPQEIRDALVNNAEAAIAAVLALNGAVIWILRAATTSPMADAIRKWKES